MSLFSNKTEGEASRSRLLAHEQKATQDSTNKVAAVKLSLTWDSNPAN